MLLSAVANALCHSSQATHSSWVRQDSSKVCRLSRRAFCGTSARGTWPWLTTFSAEDDDDDEDDESVAADEISASQRILSKKGEILRERVPEVAVLILNDYETKAVWATPHREG